MTPIFDRACCCLFSMGFTDSYISFFWQTFLKPVTERLDFTSEKSLSVINMY